METALKNIVELVGLFCELATVVVVAIGAIEATIRLAWNARDFHTMPARKRMIWVRFASWILLALEFALAADIVRTAVAPTWDDIGQLAAIAAIRTFLNYFLAKDVETISAELEKSREAEAAKERSGKT